MAVQAKFQVGRLKSDHLAMFLNMNDRGCGVRRAKCHTSIQESFTFDALDHSQAVFLDSRFMP